MNARPWSEDLSAEELKEAFANMSLDDLVEKYAVDGEYDDYYEAVAQRLIALGPAGMDLLHRELERRRIPQLRAALAVLSLHDADNPEFVGKIRSFVEDPEPAVAADAIRLLGYLRVADIADSVRALINHPSPFVRGSVLQYLENIEPDTAYPFLKRALGDEHYIVRETAIDSMDDLGLVTAIPDIQPLLNDPHEHVRQAAHTALRNLANLTEGAD